MNKQNIHSYRQFHQIYYFLHSEMSDDEEFEDCYSDSVVSHLILYTHTHTPTRRFPIKHLPL